MIEPEKKDWELTMNDLYEQQSLIRARYEMLTKEERKHYQEVIRPKRMEVWHSRDWGLVIHKDPSAGPEFCRMMQEVSHDTLTNFEV